MIAEFNQGMIIDLEESGEGKDTESSEKTEEQAPKTSEPVSEAERLRAEDDGVNYEKESSDIK